MEWNDIRHDLQVLTEVEVREGEDTYLLRTPLEGVAGKVLQGTGVAIPPIGAACSVEAAEICGAKGLQKSKNSFEL